MIEGTLENENKALFIGIRICQEVALNNLWCAIKLGSASSFDFKGLIFDNITIAQSHRGLGLQIRGGNTHIAFLYSPCVGNVSEITFSNINISAKYYDPSWWRRAEPIYLTTCPRDSSAKEGSISNVVFINIIANSENGVFLSGSKHGLLSNLRFINVNLTCRRWKNYSSGLIDYRPGCQELVNHSIARVIMDHTEGLEVENVNMRWSDHQSGHWNNPLDFRPSTGVNGLSNRMVDELEELWKKLIITEEEGVNGLSNRMVDELEELWKKLIITEEEIYTVLYQIQRFAILQEEIPNHIERNLHSTLPLTTTYFPFPSDLRKKIIHAGSYGGGNNIKNEFVQTMEGKAVLGESYDLICLDSGSSLFTIGFDPPQCMSIPCKIFFTSFCSCEHI
ncbi:hypothetical protein CFP56_021728 [Quercus suber]|uniref:Uncharacterized protein n=1 Tax=Quercus suber TaxID=58331 RepID=A0AAW0KCN7_QUESU